MTTSDRDFLIGLGVALLFIALLIGASLIRDPIACKARWEDSGHAVKWSVAGGCRVEVEPGRWVPEKNVRPNRE